MTELDDLLGFLEVHNIASPRKAAKEDFGVALLGVIGSVKKVPPLTPRSYLRGSSMGDLCAREEILAARFGKVRLRTIDPGTAMVMGIGRNFHTWVQHVGHRLLVGSWECKSKVRISGYAYALPCNYRTDSDGHPRIPKPEGPCPKCGGVGRWKYVEHLYKDKELLVRGHPDGFRRITDDPEDDEILEFKTAAEWPWKRQDEPYQVYQAQVQVYLWLTGLKRARIILVNKNGGGDKGKGWFKEFEYGRDEQEIARLKQRAIDIHAGIKTNKLVSRICVDDRCKRAKDCEMAYHCFRTKEGVETNAIGQ